MMALLHVPVDCLMLRPAWGAGKTQGAQNLSRNAAEPGEKAGFCAVYPMKSRLEP
jgi:hypothetical protein